MFFITRVLILRCINLCIISSIKPIDSSTFSHMFECASFIIASKDCTLEEAMEDAIKANAEDVEEIEHETSPCFKVFKFNFFYSNNLLKQISILIHFISIFICYSLKVNFFIQKKLQHN